MSALPYPDRFHLTAAVGWLMLGNADEAHHEFDRLSGTYESNADYWHVRCRLLIAAGRWSSALVAGQKQLSVAPDSPHGWINQAYCLHELSRTREAFDTLRRAWRRFPDHHLITFNLACYCCHLARFGEALAWVNRTIELVRQR